ncbi:MAG: FixH family protein [Sulfurimonas sp.]|nr:FixH family protein [Sulfurimonas sp.]
MKKILTVLFALALSVALLQGAAFDKDAKSRSTKIHISSNKPLTTGSNTFILDITQKDKVLKDAKISVKAFMPAMPGMPAMASKAKAKDLGNGKYEVTVNIAMSGTWQFHIFIAPAKGKKSRVKTSFNF